MIKLENVSKSYGVNEVLDNINVRFEKGKIYGLLGRNGVGKTTLLRIISNIITDFSGIGTIDGEKIKENQSVVEDIILVHNKMIPSTFDPESIKSIYNWAKMLLPNWDEDYKNYLVKTFNLDTKSKYGKLSEGNKNLVSLILGLASNSKVMLFDEPSTGLDANNRYKFYKLLMEKMEEEEKYCVISTHIIDEAENVFEKVLILENKKLILDEEVPSIQEKALTISGSRDFILEILKNKNVIDSKTIGGMKIISIYDDLTDEERIDLKARNAEIQSIPLQDLFVLLTEKEEGNESY